MSMAFTVYGRVAGLPVAIRWHEGHLDGPVIVTLPISERVRAGDHVWASPTGPAWLADLEVLYVAWLLIRDALDEVEQVTGEAPELPGASEPPPGA
jgi:hypothetical protein